MARNSLTDVDSGVEGWDTTINENNDVLGENPLPIVEYSTVGSMPSAASHDRSICAAQHGEIGYSLFISDGNDWLLPPTHWVLYCANVVLSGTSAIALEMETYPTGTGGLPIVFPVDTLVVGVAVNAIQYDGADPGDWTIRASNITTAANADFSSVTFATAASARQQSKGKLDSGGLSLSAGDELKMSAFGPAVTSGVAIGCTFWGVSYHTETWPTS